MFIKNTIKNKVEAYKEKTIKTANDTVEALFKLVVICLILFTLIWISVFLYVVFYHAYVPSLEHVKPVNLQYSPCDDFKKGICSFPEAHIQLTKSVHILMVGQPYKIALVLEMPESPANKELGMFMVCGRLVSKDSSVVANSCRSAMLKYHSTLVRILSTLFFAPLYIFDTLDEKQSVIVELFPNFEEDQNYPVTDVYITVQSYFTEIYSSKLHITAQMRGLRYFMYNWPVLSAGLGISLIILIIMFIATLSWWQLYGPYREYGMNFSILYVLKHFFLFID
ncbi:hypothetical protein AAG570_001169 [Ranatra chinensis]|uniref:Seipin n=1 Tax=Ranatra chinensis TaxID=642074 RepID=A0ABD0YTN9_9HEMI